MKKVLFLCVANSARSQMVECLGKNILFDLAEVASAGSKPSGEVHPMAVEVLREIHLSTFNQYSKSIESLPKDFIKNLDYIITLCADEVCPVLPNENAQRLSWTFKDPKKIEDFQKIRDSLIKKMEKFKKEL